MQEQVFFFFFLKRNSVEMLCIQFSNTYKLIMMQFEASLECKPSKQWLDHLTDFLEVFH